LLPLINRRREKSPNDEDLTGVDDARFYFVTLGLKSSIMESVARISDDTWGRTQDDTWNKDGGNVLRDFDGL
jgi:hypothetical protein